MRLWLNSILLTWAAVWSLEAFAVERISVFVCRDAAGSVSYHPAAIHGAKCEQVASSAVPERLMIHQDATLQVLAEIRTVTRSESSAEARLVFNYPVSGKDTPGSHRSLLRHQRFDCRTGGGVATLEEQSFDVPLARGTPVSVTRTPSAVFRPIVDGSADAAVRRIVCGK